MIKEKPCAAFSVQTRYVLFYFFLFTMKSDAYVLVTGLMIAALASLPEVQSQGDAYLVYFKKCLTNSDSPTLTNLMICKFSMMEC